MIGNRLEIPWPGRGHDLAKTGFPAWTSVGRMAGSDVATRLAGAWTNDWKCFGKPLAGMWKFREHVTDLVLDDLLANGGT
jgi:hypothetical protein